METRSSAAFELSPVCHVQTAEKRVSLITWHTGRLIMLEIKVRSTVCKIIADDCLWVL